MPSWHKLQFLRMDPNNFSDSGRVVHPNQEEVAFRNVIRKLTTDCLKLKYSRSVRLLCQETSSKYLYQQEKQHLGKQSTVLTYDSASTLPNS